MQKIVLAAAASLALGGFVLIPSHSAQACFDSVQASASDGSSVLAQLGDTRKRDRARNGPSAPSGSSGNTGSANDSSAGSSGGGASGADGGGAGGDSGGAGAGSGGAGGGSGSGN